VDSIQDTFRVSSIVHQASSASPQIEVPLSLEESSSGALASSCLLNLSSVSETHGLTEFAVTVTAVQKALYADSDRFLTNPLHVSVHSNVGPGTLIFTLQNHELQEYPEFGGSVVVSTNCSEGEYSRHELLCPGDSSENVTVVHTCAGSQSRQSTVCPVVRIRPSCVVVSGGDFNCTLLGYNASSTVCACTPNALARRLSSSSVSVSSVWSDVSSLEVVAASLVVIDDFTTTILTADDLKAADLGHAVIVLVLYGILWSAGLFVVGLFTWNHYQLQSKIDKPDHKKSASDRSSEIHEYLISYGTCSLTLPFFSL
jgi:hypothetical protein